MTWVRSWKVRPYWFVFTASSSKESVPPPSFRNWPMLVSGFCCMSGGLLVLGSRLLLPFTWSL